MSRIETGAVQFGDDWPGVFIRGDNAFHYGTALQSLLDGGEFDRLALNDLAELLLSTRVSLGVEPVRLKPAEEARDV